MDQFNSTASAIVCCVVYAHHLKVCPIPEPAIDYK